MVIISRCMKAGIRKLLIAVILSVSLADSAGADLAKAVDAILSRPSQKKAQFSIHIVKADTGQAVYSHNANKALVPASNMKIITTAAALKYLGANYEYKTQVGLCPAPTGTGLYGNTLVVIGSGDPLLGDKITDAKYGRSVGWLFDDIATKLRQNGITAVSDIIIDTNIFDDRLVHPNWPKAELNRWYACEVSGLNYNGNCINMTAKKTNGKVSISVEPGTNYVKLINKVTATQKGKSAAGAYRSQVPNTLIVKGKCRKQAGPFAVAIERPAAFFGFLLAEHLNDAGITADGRLVEKALDCNFRPLAEYRSSLTDCLARCNKDSFGLAAEALVKTIAANSTANKKNGSWAKGKELIEQYLLGLGIEHRQFNIDDGSGLSKQNSLSANAITKVLLDVHASANWRLYKDSLAVAGVDGTIARRFKDKKYKGKIFGKTGYINNVKSFSGLCTTDDGHYLFSILANNANAKTRKAINDIAKTIIDSRQ